MPKDAGKFKPNWIPESKPTPKQSGRKERDPRYSTARWQKVRALHLRDKPLCVECEKKGIIKQANVLDHVIPHRINGSIDFFDSSNHQGLCTRCHNSKSAIERKAYDYNTKDSKPEVILVYGPPGSGKTTWAMQQQYTVLIDMDLIWQDITGLGWYDRPKHLLPRIYAEHDRRIDNISKLQQGDKAIVITTNLKSWKVKQLMKIYKPSLNRLYVTKDECIQRVMQDDRRQDKQQHIDLIEKWFNTNE